MMNSFFTRRSQQQNQTARFSSVDKNPSFLSSPTRNSGNSSSREGSSRFSPNKLRQPPKYGASSRAIIKKKGTQVSSGTLQRRPSVSRIDTFKLNQTVGQLRQKFTDQQPASFSSLQEPTSLLNRNQTLRMATLDEDSDLGLKSTFSRKSMMKQHSIKRTFQIRIENTQPTQDSYFIKNLLGPYLSSIYFGLLARQNKDYLTLVRAKQYLNLPELIGNRVVKQINANGDERIDHDEFVGFMMNLLMGTFDQKMLIAFRCYDVDFDETISKEEAQIVLKNIPISVDDRYGRSFGINEATMSRVELMNQKREDSHQIETLLEAIFKEYPEGMYFNEFKQLAKEVTCELFYSIYDCFYQCIPCAKNFLLMKKNYKKFLLSDAAVQLGLRAQQHTFMVLMPPVTKKIGSRVQQEEDKLMARRKQSVIAMDAKKKRAQVVAKRDPIKRGNSISDIQVLPPPPESPKAFEKIGGSTKDLPDFTQTLKQSSSSSIESSEVDSASLKKHRQLQTIDHSATIKPELLGFNSVIKEVEENSDSSSLMESMMKSKKYESSSASPQGMIPQQAVFKLRQIYQSDEPITFGFQKSNAGLQTMAGSTITKNSAAGSAAQSLNPNTPRGALSISNQSQSDFTQTLSDISPKGSPPVIRHPSNYRKRSSRRMFVKPDEIDFEASSSEFSNSITPHRDVQVLPLVKAQNSSTQPTTQTPTNPLDLSRQHSKSSRDKAKRRGSSIDTSKLGGLRQTKKKSILMGLDRKKKEQNGQRQNLINIQIQEKLYKRQKACFFDKSKSENVSPSGGGAATAQPRRMSLTKYSTISSLPEISKGEADGKLSKVASEFKKHATLQKGNEAQAHPQLQSQRTLSGQGEELSVEADESVVLDGFQIPLKTTMLKISGKFITLTSSGAFRTNFMSLTNQELYLYPSKENALKHEMMVMLAPGAFVRARSVVQLSTEQQVSLKNTTKVYPLELYVGGSISNYGLKFLMNPHSGTSSGILTFFYDSQDMQQNWLKFLEKATGSYNISDYYMFSGRFDPKASKAAARKKRNSSLVKHFVNRPSVFDKRFMDAFKDEFSEGEREEEEEQNSKSPGHILGYGKSESVVVKGLHKASKKEVAIKIVSKKGKTITQIDQLRDVIKMYQLAQHHNVVRLEDYFESKESIYLCLELHSNQTLEDYVKHGTEPLTEQRIRELTQKIGQALQYLHSSGILLKNLSIQGILMTDAHQDAVGGVSSSIPRISHLDKAAVMGFDDYARDPEGDARFRAPEVVMCKPYSFKADVWSYGIIMYFLLSGGKLPFELDEDEGSIDSSDILSGHSDTKIEKVEEKIMNQPIIFQELKGKGYSQACLDVLGKTLEKDPRRRFDISMVLDHDWFKLNLEMVKDTQDEITVEKGHPEMKETRSSQQGVSTLKDEIPTASRVKKTLSRRQTTIIKK